MGEAFELLAASERSCKRIIVEDWATRIGLVRCCLARSRSREMVEDMFGCVISEQTRTHRVLLTGNGGRWVACLAMLDWVGFEH
jgi:hypothetical protein